MRKNEIRNEGKNRCVGFLFYYEKSDTCVIELSPEVKAEEAPAWFRPFLEKKIFTLDPVSSRKYLESWSSEKDGILWNRYYEPDWLKERKKRHLTQAIYLKDARFYLTFADGRSGAVDLTKELQEDKSFSDLLKKPEEMRTARISAGGSVLDFGSGHFLMSRELYDMPLSGILPEDARAFLQGSLVDVPDLCAELGVSRQYINRRLQEEGVQPFRKCGGNNLYLRGVVFPLFDY